MANQFVIIGEGVHEVPEDVHRWCIYANSVIKQAMEVRRLQNIKISKPASISLKAVISQEQKLDNLLKKYPEKSEEDLLK